LLTLNKRSAGDTLASAEPPLGRGRRTKVQAAIPRLCGVDLPATGNSQSVFSAPDSFILWALGRNKLVIAACALAMALAGIAFGMLRQPVYTASASLQIGQVNPNSPGFLGYVQSASSLAAAFSRSIEAAPVLNSIDRKLGLPPEKSVTRLSSAPIPLSPVFRVTATGPTRSAATRLANVAAGAVVAYESNSNSSNPQARSLLLEYRQAAFAVQHAKATLRKLQGEKPSSNAILEAEARTISAQVRLKAVGNAYNAAIVSQAPRKGLVTLLAGASSASSDRTPKTELYGFLGLLIGVAIGCLVAVLREQRQSSRALSVPAAETA
jgi:capsular polysaccharide biosynthesis protein